MRWRDGTGTVQDIYSLAPGQPWVLNSDVPTYHPGAYEYHDDNDGGILYRYLNHEEDHVHDDPNDKLEENANIWNGYAPLSSIPFGHGLGPLPTPQHQPYRPKTPEFPTRVHDGIHSNLNANTRPFEPRIDTRPFPYNRDSFKFSRDSIDAATQGQISKLVTGVSVNYLGDPYLKANQSANIPDALNTSVWITNLPPNLTHKMLLDNVRNCGKVYAAVVNKPEQNHITAASKIVFFDVAGAENLLRQAREGGFIIEGFVPRVCRNRIKCEEKPPSPNSRVLHIEGPSCIVNQPNLAAMFRRGGITWQDEVVITLSSNETVTRLEWRFGSYRCQAESARHLIDRVKRNREVMPWNESQLWQCVTVHFGVDPCAPQPRKGLWEYPQAANDVDTTLVQQQLPAQAHLNALQQISAQRPLEQHQTIPQHLLFTGQYQPPDVRPQNTRFQDTRPQDLWWNLHRQPCVDQSVHQPAA
ncbi:hypothetical protein F4777DRAFT_90604 [Nemania sp. FL0916]|nr:hypothetical protein F4777DRAFT_90604 [Nemania sp. FL0916]